jgi:hypothetical protein
LLDFSDLVAIAEPDSYCKFSAKFLNRQILKSFF